MAIAVDVKKLSGLGRQLTVTVPADAYTKQVKSRLNSYKDQVRMPGFRKGHVPQAVLEQRFGEYARGEVAEQVIRESLQEALTEQGLQPADQPKVDITQQADNQPFIYTAEFEQYPEVQLPDLAKLKVKTPAVTLSDEDMQEGIDEIRKQYIEWKEVDRESQAGDQVVIDFVGRHNGEPFEGGSGQQQPVILGQGQMLEDFEKPLLGKRAGDTLEFPLTFPKDYAAELAGTTVQFAVKIHTVSEGALPEIGEALFEKLQLEDKSEAGLQAEVRQTLEKDVDARAGNLKKKRVSVALRGKAKLEMPETFLKREIHRLVHQAPKDEQAALHDLSPSDKKHPLVQQARDNVTDALVLHHLIDHFKLTVSDADMRDHVASMSMPFLENEAMQRYLFENEEWVQNAQMQILERKAYDKAAETMQVSDEKVSLTDLRTKVTE